MSFVDADLHAFARLANARNHKVSVSANITTGGLSGRCIRWLEEMKIGA